MSFRTALLLPFLVAAGCSPAPQTEAEAPRDFEAFLDGAAAALQEEESVVPLPEAVRGPQRWRADHLADRLSEASVETTWQPPDATAEPLAVLTDISTSEPRENVRERREARRTLEGGEARVLVVRGFRVERELTGAIRLRIQVPYGRHFELQWGEAGRIAVPVHRHDEPIDLWIPTDGFAEWEGTLRRLRFILDGDGDGALTIDRLEFLPKTTAYPEAVGVKRTRRGEDLRSAIYLRDGSSVAFDVDVPPRARLQTALAVEGSDSVRFDVVVRHGGETHALTSQQLTSIDHWLGSELSLERWSGDTVTLVLRADTDDPDAVALWAEPTVYEAVDDPPVVVLYLIDTLSSEHIQTYGYSRETMPRLAAFADGGVLFSDMVSNSSRTIESIPDLMLSVPTERHGVWHYLLQAPTGMTTLAEALRNAGFATASFCTNVNAGPRQAMDQGFDRFIDKIGYWWTDVDRTVPLDDVRTWLDEQAHRPTFVYIHTAEPHAPYAPKDGFSDRFDPDYDGTVDGTYEGDTGFRYRSDPRDVEHVVALYDEEIAYADHRFGLFLDALGDRNAHVFVTSDHGEEFLEHAQWEHGENLHNEQTRVPLVAAGPDLSSGVTVDAPVQLFDVMPTILDLFSIRAPHETAGESLLPLLREGESSPWGRRTRFASNHFMRAATPPADPVIQYSVIEDARWKLIYGFQNLDGAEDAAPRFALYDLENDPRERVDVLSEHEDLARSMIETLVAWKRAQQPYERPSAPATLSLEETRALEALGYLEAPKEKKKN